MSEYVSDDTSVKMEPSEIGNGEMPESFSYFHCVAKGIKSDIKLEDIDTLEYKPEVPELVCVKSEADVSQLEVDELVIKQENEDRLNM